MPEAPHNYILGMKLSENIIKFCQDRGLSLARLSKLSGVPKTNLHAWSTGRTTLDLKQLKKVANVLKVSVHELVYGELDPYEPSSETILKEIFSGDIRVTVHRIERRRPSDGKA